MLYTAFVYGVGYNIGVDGTDSLKVGHFFSNTGDVCCKAAQETLPSLFEHSPRLQLQRRDSMMRGRVGMKALLELKKKSYKQTRFY